MKIRLSEKHFRIRLSIILTFCFLTFIIWMTIWFLFEMGLKKTELNRGEGVVLFVHESYDTINRLHRPTKYEPCIDIMLGDNQPFIRLSKDYEKYRDVFKNLKVVNKLVTYLYHDRRRYKTYKVYNPSELIIDGRKIIDFDIEHENNRIFIPLFLTIDISVLCFLVIAVITYREKLADEDRLLIANKAYFKLIRKWWSG